jgi:hypothetical protein
VFAVKITNNFILGLNVPQAHEVLEDFMHHMLQLG